MAVMEAQQWADKMENRQALAEIVGKRQWFNVPVADINDAPAGRHQLRQWPRGQGRQPLHEVLGRGRRGLYPGRASTPGSSRKIIRWGKFEPTLDIKALVDKTNRADLWREAAKTLGRRRRADLPTSRGVETFFDGVKFDPGGADGLPQGLKIKRIRLLGL